MQLSDGFGQFMGPDPREHPTGYVDERAGDGAGLRGSKERSRLRDLFFTNSS